MHMTQHNGRERLQGLLGEQIRNAEVEEALRQAAVAVLEAHEERDYWRRGYAKVSVELRAVVGVVMHARHTRRMVITEREFNQIDKGLRIAISNPEPGIRVYEIHDTGEGDVVVVQ
jgi:hypothetical protein